MIQKNGLGEMKTLKRSPRMTSGVAIRSFQASNNITNVIAIPATNPASNPQNAALLRLSPSMVEMRYVCGRLLTRTNTDWPPAIRAPSDVALQSAFSQRDPQKSGNDSGAGQERAA